MLAKIKKFDERHRSSRLDVTPLDLTGLKVNDKSISAWEKYSEDYAILKNEENTGEGEVFMRPMPSFLKYLEKQNFVEKQERKLKIGTYSGNSQLKRLQIEEENDHVETAPLSLEMERVKIDQFSDDEVEEVDLHDAFLDKQIEIPHVTTEYKTYSFLNAVKLHTADMDDSKKALWNDCVLYSFPSGVLQEPSYSHGIYTAHENLNMVATVHECCGHRIQALVNRVGVSNQALDTVPLSSHVCSIIYVL